MRFGRFGTIRGLLLFGGAAALLAASPPALARRHHPTKHQHSTHTNNKHENPDQTGSAPPAGTQSNAPGTASANTPASAAPGGLELVPGPVPLPPGQKGAANPLPGPGQNGAAAPAAKDPPAAPGKDQSDAGTGDSATAAAAAPEPVAISPTPVAAKSAIDTAVAKLFLGEPVYGAGGEPLGELSQIVPGPDGEVKSVVLTWGGMFGYFQSRRTIPWPEAGPTIQGGKLVLQHMTKAALRNNETPQPEARQ